MPRRRSRWMIALTIVAGGGILAAVFVLRDPIWHTLANLGPRGSRDEGTAARNEGATPPRARLTGIAKAGGSKRQAPLRFASPQPAQMTPAIPATVDDAQAGVRRTSTEVSAGPALGRPLPGEPALGDALPAWPALGSAALPGAESAATPAPLRAAPSGALQPPPTAAGTSAARSPAATLAAPVFGGPRQGFPPTIPPEEPSDVSADELLSPPIERNAALRRAAQHNQDGFALAAKGAWYSARAEFQSALELIAGAADAVEGTSARSRAVSEAQIALREATDFVPRSGTRSGRIDVAHLVGGHQAKVIDVQTARSWTAAAAHEAYLAFARRRLADAGAGQRAASVSLHGLGKVHAAIGAADREGADSRKKALTFYEAALEAGPDNFIAVNDLAVLLAEEGDLERGRAALESGLRISRQPAMLENLAVVYGRLGRPDLAGQLRAEAASLERQATAGAGELLPTYDVRWLDPRTFASTARGGGDPGRSSAPTGQPAMGQMANGPTARWPMQPATVNPNFGMPAAAATTNAPPGAPGAAAPPQVPSTAVRPVRNALVY